LEEEQERGGKIEGTTGARGTSPTTAIDNATITSVAEEARNASSVGNNRACSDGGSGKNRCGNDTPSAEGKGHTKKPLCYGCEQEEK